MLLASGLMTGTVHVDHSRYFRSPVPCSSATVTATVSSVSCCVTQWQCCRGNDQRDVHMAPSQLLSPLAPPSPRPAATTRVPSRPRHSCPRPSPLLELPPPPLHLPGSGDTLGLTCEATPSGEPSRTSHDLSFSGPSVLLYPVSCLTFLGDGKPCAGRSVFPLVAMAHSPGVVHSRTLVNMLMRKTR